MVFIFGGAYQGKLDYVKERWSCGDADVYDCGAADFDTSRLFDKKIINHFDRFVLHAVRNGADPLEFVEAHRKSFENRIVIMDDISQGVVPVEPSARKWREANGRVMQALAKEAEEVVRVFCGLGQIMKRKG